MFQKTNEKFLKMLPIVFIVLITCQYCRMEDVQDTTLEDAKYWNMVAKEDLIKSAVNKKLNNGVAKNVIVFLGDGMGVSTVTAARILRGQLKGESGETGYLNFETFPYSGISKTYSVNTQTTDSSAGATAVFTGVKTNKQVVGLDSTASKDPCKVDDKEKHELDSIMDWAQEKSLSTGIVTTAKVTHGTPAPTYAHVINRHWECDSIIPTKYKGCVKDIARQLVEDEPGKNFKVILGGGRAQFQKAANSSCTRNDGRNLIKDWKIRKANAQFVGNKDELLNIDASKTDYLLGLFSPSHMSFAGDDDENQPSLTNMTIKAIEILKKNPKGFFLMVEGGLIDIGHHDNIAELALQETLEMDDAVGAAKAMTDSSDTLIIVTADHSHAMTMVGYPKRGNNILGFADTNNNTFMETLSYANGPGYKYHYIKVDYANCSSTDCTDAEKDSAVYRKDFRESDSDRTFGNYFRQLSGVFRSKASHGGEDVSIYGSGPKAHLLTGVHEQNYIAHVISCAACVGPHKELCCEKGGRPKVFKSSSSRACKISDIVGIILPVIFILNLYLILYYY